MAIATFDTLKFANTLKAAGVPDKQAEAEAAAFAEVIQVNFKELATREDLARLGSDLRHEMKEMEYRLNAKIDGVAAKLDAKIDGVAAKLDAKIDGVAAKLDAKIDGVAAKLDAKIDGVAAKLDAKISALDAKLEKSLSGIDGQFKLLRWMIGITWTTSVVTIGILLRYLVFRGIP